MRRARVAPVAAPAVDASRDVRLRRRLFVAFYAVSGAAALIYEVTWTRLLTMQMGNTVAAASTVLAAFMCGLAVGAWLAGRFPAAQSRRLYLYAALEGAVALAAHSEGRDLLGCGDRQITNRESIQLRENVIWW